MDHNDGPAHQNRLGCLKKWTFSKQEIFILSILTLIAKLNDVVIMDISKFRLDESVLEFDVHIDTLVTKKLSHVTETDTGESVWHVTKEMA